MTDYAYCPEFTIDAIVARRDEVSALAYPVSFPTDCPRCERTAVVREEHLREAVKVNDEVRTGARWVAVCDGCGAVHTRRAVPAPVLLES